jgi:hypothetical protein
MAMKSGRWLWVVPIVGLLLLLVAGIGLVPPGELGSYAAWLIGPILVILVVVVMKLASDASNRGTKRFVDRLQEQRRARAAEERQRLATWPRGRGTVLHLIDLGGRENDSIQARCELEIRGEDFRSAPYRVSLELFVPPLGVPRVMPGSTVPVAVDPADKNAVVILWEEP